MKKLNEMKQLEKELEGESDLLLSLKSGFFLFQGAGAKLVFLGESPQEALDELLFRRENAAE